MQWLDDIRVNPHRKMVDQKTPSRTHLNGEVSEVRIKIGAAVCAACIGAYATVGGSAITTVGACFK